MPAGFGADGDLALRWNADAATRRKHFHDLTPCSRGVLANQRDGGLRRDLTVFLLSKGEVPDSPDAPPLTDDSPMLGGGDESLTCMSLDMESVFAPFCLPIGDLNVNGLGSQRWSQMIYNHLSSDRRFFRRQLFLESFKGQIFHKGHEGWGGKDLQTT